MQKLPEDFHGLVTRDLGSDTWVLTDTMKAFHKELLLKEQCSSYDASPARSHTQRDTKHPSTTLALYAETKERKGTWCIFCGKNHSSSKCNVVMNPESRRKILKEKGRCFLCLCAKHLSRNCLSGMRCLKCNGLHQTSICDAESVSATNTCRVSTGSQSGESCHSHHFKRWYFS